MSKAICRTLPLLALLAAPAMPPAAAQEAMTGAGFDSYTRGKTLFYGLAGEIYGAERYLDGQRVVWSFLDGHCKAGHWYERGRQICFVYDDQPEPQCWSFRRSAGGLSARYENDASAPELYEAESTGRDMICTGPDVGV